MTDKIIKLRDGLIGDVIVNGELATFKKSYSKDIVTV